MDLLLSHLLPIDFSPQGVNEYVSPCPIQPINPDTSFGLTPWLPKLATMMKNVTVLDSENLFIKRSCKIYVDSFSLIYLQKL